MSRVYLEFNLFTWFHVKSKPYSKQDVSLKIDKLAEFIRYACFNSYDLTL